MKDLIRMSNELLNMKKNMDRLVESFIRPTTKIDYNNSEDTSFTPLVSATENNDELRLYVLLPFGKKDKISINIKDNILTIEGETSIEIDKNTEIIRDEIPTGKFSRSFKIGINVDSTKTKASYKDGVLQIILPKKEDAKSNKIEIE